MNRRKTQHSVHSFHSVFVKLHVQVLSAVPHEVCFFTMHKSNEFTKAKTATDRSEKRQGCDPMWPTLCDLYQHTKQSPAVSHIMVSLISWISTREKTLGWLILITFASLVFTFHLYGKASLSQWDRCVWVKLHWTATYIGPCHRILMHPY